MAADPETERLWRSRARWRFRGAWQWPTFVAATVADAVILSRLPFAGDGAGIVPSLLIAGFINLAVVAVLAPIGGAVLRRRSPSLPRMIASDRAGTALLLATVALLVVGGLLHRPAVREADADFAAQAEAARRFVGHRAPAEYRANVDRADTWQPGPDVYRTCVPGRDARRAFCVIVDTAQNPPSVRRDPDATPNARLAAASAP